MSAREKSFVTRKDERLASTVLEVGPSLRLDSFDMADLQTWRDHTRDRIDGAIADHHFLTRLQRQTVRSWRYLAEHKHGLEIIEAGYAINRTVTTKSTVFAKWRKRLSLINAEERVLLHKEQNLVSQTWKIWRTAT
jgi:hypothetical protein